MKLVLQFPAEFTLHHVFSGKLIVEQQSRPRLVVRVTRLDKHHRPMRLVVEGERVVMQIHDDEGVLLGPITGAPDARGNPTVLQNVQVRSSDPAVTVEPLQPDGTVKVLAAGPLVTGAVVTVDAQDADGNALPSFSLALDVIAEDATAFNVPVGPAFKQ